MRALRSPADRSVGRDIHALGACPTASAARSRSRACVTALLSETPEVEMVVAVADRSTLPTIERERPDVVVTDIRMPPTIVTRASSSPPSRGTRARRSASSSSASTPNPTMFFRLLENGSSRRAYLLKDRMGRSGQLLDAVCAVYAGRSYVDPKIVESACGKPRARGGFAAARAEAT